MNNRIIEIGNKLFDAFEVIAPWLVLALCVFLVFHVFGPAIKIIIQCQ